MVLSSFSGEVGLPMRTAYCASKFALTGFFEALRMETAPKRQIDICIICPPSVKTKFREHAIGSSQEAAQDLNNYHMTLEVSMRDVLLVMLPSDHGSYRQTSQESILSFEGIFSYICATYIARHSGQKIEGSPFTMIEKFIHKIINS